MDRYLRFTRDKEPVLSASVVGAFLLALADKAFALSDGDLSIWGPAALIVGGIIVRKLVYSPDSYLRALYSPPPDDEEGA